MEDTHSLANQKTDKLKMYQKFGPIMKQNKTWHDFNDLWNVQT